MMRIDLAHIDPAHLVLSRTHCYTQTDEKSLIEVDKCLGVTSITLVLLLPLSLLLPSIDTLSFWVSCCYCFCTLSSIAIAIEEVGP